MKIPDNNKQNRRVSHSRKTCYRIICMMGIFLLFGISETHSQQAANYELHANIIYRFTKYIDWPREKKTGDFIIGVVGESPLFDELKIFTANKTVGTQKIIIRKFLATSTTFNCHILFVGEDESSNVKKIAEITVNSSTLLVSEMEGLAKKGSCINMVIVNDRLKLEINTNNIGKRDLSVATELLQLGVIVK